MSSSFSSFASETASTKRSPAAVEGKIGAPVEYLTGLSIVPLMPVNPETVLSLGLSSPREAKQTFIDTIVDVAEGDVLVVDGAEYAVRSVAEWNGGTDQSFVHLVVEEIKGS